MNTFLKKLSLMMAAGSLLAATATATLTYDVRATLLNGVALSGGNSSKSLSGLAANDVVTFELYAMVTGTAAGVEGYQNGYGKLASTGAGLLGNLGNYAFAAPFSNTGSQLGAVQDIDGDGDLDIGSNALKNTS